MKKVAIYLRLSKEDEYIRDESNSISSQRALIKKHIRGIPELKKMETVEFKDDGYTGKNMNRPGMQDLLTMVKAQKIGCIVVKDISRFSRDHLETGKYLEQIFPFMGVRFIAINDNYDSKDFVGGIGEIDVAFKGILYDFYSEDLSEKIKTSFEVSRAKGKYQATLAPYGYRKDPNDKYSLLIDDEAAEVVRRIFREYIEGKSAYQIAQDLNGEDVEAPAVYIKRTVGYDCQKDHKGKMIWNNATVMRMLRNESYVGTYVYHKYEQTAVGGGAKKVLDPEKWKRVPNNHPAIISDADFERVQNRLAQNKKHGFRKPVHPLSRKVECGLCHHNMRHESSGYPKFTCAHMYLDKGNWHERNTIRDKDLEPIVLAAIHKQLDLRVSLAEIREERRQVQQEKVGAAESRLGDMRLSLERLHGDQMEAFEAYKDGTTDKETFLQQKTLYDQLEIKLNEGIQKQTAVVKALEQELDAMPEGLTVVDEIITADKLTKELVDTFVEKVILKPERQVEIVWKFQK